MEIGGVEACGRDQSFPIVDRQPSASEHDERFGSQPLEHTVHMHD
jgi:hypothetical protein